MLNQKGFTIIELIFALGVIFLTSGEIMCIYRFCKCDFEPSYKAEIIYAASFVTGVGGITGYIDFGK